MSKWMTKSGELIKISDMSDYHLINCLKLLIRNYNKILVECYPDVPESIIQFKIKIFLDLLKEYKKRDMNVALLEVYHKDIIKGHRIINKVDNFNFNFNNYFDEEDFDEEEAIILEEAGSTDCVSAKQVFGVTHSAYLYPTTDQSEVKPKKKQKNHILRKINRPKIYVPGNRKINLD